MSEIIRIIGIGFAGGMLALMLRKHRPEFALFIGLVTSAVILAGTVEWVSGIMTGLRQLIEDCGVDTAYFSMIVKVVGTAYISQFAAEILRDSGEKAVASKVEAAGKICILALTLPVLASFMELCIGVVNSV